MLLNIFKLDKDYFKNLIGINIQSKITVVAINLNVRLTALIHSKNQSFDVNGISGNLNNLPMMESILVSAHQPKHFFLFYPIF